ncbi:MAG TPA: Holliday junction branch migration protein RuvA [Candidatus Paceibacterota bacterium]|jgi:Holliday junction DNA helicase RuvA|nr:Holliday junction branch migration protein RuvA [Candidatus Paceibacterota bacterium]
MIARITGTVVEQFEKGVVIEVGGIGYAVFTPATVDIGSIAALHTYLVIRDDAQELYGFETAKEKMFFTKLISVSGVGPKTALQMLSLYPLTELVRIVKSNDAKAVSLVPGVGKKTAEKIIIDLKDKLGEFESAETGPQSDLVEALLSLGYKEYQIRSVVGSVDVALPLQKQITSALQMLGK